MFVSKLRNLIKYGFLRKSGIRTTFCFVISYRNAVISATKQDLLLYTSAPITGFIISNRESTIAVSLIHIDVAVWQIVY